jgi:hypothetical protein
MQRNLTRQPAATITRAQFSMMHALGDEISLTADDRRRALDLTERQWLRWADFLGEGPLPVDPPLPEMLRRLAKVAFHLSLLTERSLAMA